MAASAVAQQDGGSILRELDRPRPLDERLPAPEQRQKREDDRRIARQPVRVRAIEIAGNTLFSDGVLTELLDPQLDDPLTLADIQGMVARIRDFYRRNGYLVRVFLPEQTVDDGALLIRVIEGQPGERTIEILPAPGSSRITPDLPREFIDRAFARERFFRIDRLERSERLLNDLPGIEADVRLSPGDDTGLTDVTVSVASTPVFSGRLTTDNAGSDSTGEARAVVRTGLDSPLGRGDQWSLTGLGSEGTGYLRLQGAIPVGYNGMRLQLAGSRLDYELVDAFSALGVEGDVSRAEAGLRYPVLRGASGSLYLDASIARSRYEDRAQAAIQERRDIDSFSIAVEADRRDTLLGGGITYGRLALRGGRVDFDIGSPERRALTGGGFELARWSLLRVQRRAGMLGQGASLRISLDGQFSPSNLPSAENYSLGGVGSVRAFPVSEVSGDDGLTLSLEWRERLNALVNLYGFYDHGWVRAPADAEPAEQTTDLAGVGLGGIVRISQRVTLDGSIARRVTGGQDRDAWQGWVSAEARF
ncbi:ShlB/FhaC/HecB family hemolysin secretion/activation protein [Spiribacter pallidus]|uniref:ShlB/FhaC/HecB family hemolysin secretion/activation protein n=1 Tax=Spiribacter pallidus TaxID=1987936 RepID=A0ABV3TCR8_9GAMM